MRVSLSLFFVIFTINLLAQGEAEVKKVEAINKLNASINYLNQVKETYRTIYVGTINWIYLKEDPGKKNDLAKEIDVQYRWIKYHSVKNSMNLPSRQRLDSLFLLVDDLIEITKHVMTSLMTFEDYSNEGKSEAAKDLLKKEITPVYNRIDAMFTEILMIEEINLRNKLND